MPSGPGARCLSLALGIEPPLILAEITAKICLRHLAVRQKMISHLRETSLVTGAVSPCARTRRDGRVRPVTATCLIPGESTQVLSGLPIAAEFFAGIGLVRMGLEESGIRVVWSNDIDRAKQEMYETHFQGRELHQFVSGDIADVHADDMPPGLSLAWASFPCVDISLAGWRRGLHGSESGTFWEFVRILKELDESKPPVVALENVVGLATGHRGRDLVAATTALNDLGYSVDILSIDARRFVPQSRPRVFIVGALEPSIGHDIDHNDPLRPDPLNVVFDNPTLRTHRWPLPDPPALMQEGLSSLVERLSRSDPRWWDAARTDAFLASLSRIQRTRLDQLLAGNAPAFRTAYRRTRDGKAVWEIRPDDISGCLRTARGGSSKQALVEIDHGEIHVRWMTPREYARLMGADDYCLDGIRRNQALSGFGDAVCVPVIRWLAQHYLLPLTSRQDTC